MLIQGWGNYPKIEGNVFEIRSISDCADRVNKSSLIPRGHGRSYGDSAIAENVLQMTHLDHFINFDEKLGQLTCEAGVTLREILQVIVPRGWFLPVTPGTSLVTIGGAIASDVHGKNHHLAGTFCEHVETIKILLGTGEIVNTSTIENPELFQATCGGMGLTGVILSARIKLKPISSNKVIQKTLKADCLDSIYEQFEINKDSTYSVAWIDCLAKGRKLGRSILMLGEHAEQGKLTSKIEKSITVPTYMPAQLLNKMTVKVFNNLYYQKATHECSTTIDFYQYFYPLDKLNNWNKLYGKSGFVQYQFVLPKTVGIEGMRNVLTKIAESGTGSFLAVLKMFGVQNHNFLSFPIEGHTLALDFKINNDTISLIRELDAMVLDFGGRIYLTKDALMTKSTFRASYPQWEKFEDIRSKFGAIGHFASAQSKRLGLL